MLPLIPFILLLFAVLTFDVKSDVLTSLSSNDGDVMNSGSERNKWYQPKLNQYHDDSDVVSVVQILTQNIVQWSFVESQLSEPQVNIAIPEIAIPLRHLSSSLALLGSVLYSRNDLYESKIVYERACPLIELTNKVDKSEIDDCFNKLTDIYDNMYNQGSLSADTGSSGVSTDENDAVSNSLSYKRKNRKRNHILNDEIEEEEKTITRTNILNSNPQNNDTANHKASIQKSSLYSLLTEINVYDTFEIENQNAQPGYFNASLRINELRSQYEHIRRNLQSSVVSSPSSLDSIRHESKQYDIVELEKFWDLPVIRELDSHHYSHEQNMQMFLHIHSMIHSYIHGDADDQSVLVRSVNTIATQDEMHPIYAVLASVMTDIDKQGSFDHYFDVLEDFFDLVGHSREFFLDAMTLIKTNNVPLVVETQLKLIIIYMFDKAYMELEQGKVFNFVQEEHDDDVIEEEFFEAPKTIDFERFADEPIDIDSNIPGNPASSNDSMSFLLCFLLFVTLLISIGVYQQVLRNRNHSHRPFRARKTNKSFNDDDFINQIYSFISNDCKKSNVDSDTSDSDSRLLRQKIVVTPVSVFSSMYDTASYYLAKLLQGSKNIAVDRNSTATTPVLRVSSKKSKTTTKLTKKGSNSSGSSVSNTSGKGKGTGKSTDQLTSHQESDSTNDGIDSDNSSSDETSDGEKTQTMAQVTTATTITNVITNEDDSEWVHAGKSSRSIKAASAVTSTTTTPSTPSTVVNPPKVRKEPTKQVNKTLPPPAAPALPNVTKDIITTTRLADMSYTAIVKSNEAIDFHNGNLIKPLNQRDAAQFNVKEVYFVESKSEASKEVAPVTAPTPEDDVDSLLMSIHAHIDSSLMNSPPDMNGPPGFENHTTGLWGSSLPTYWNNVPTMNHLDGLFMTNQTKLFPQSDLNLDAPTFVPSTPLTFLPEINRDFQIIITVNCISIGDPAFIKSAVIVLMSDTMGGSQTIGMSRSNFKPSLWTARLSLPLHYDGGILTYKYFVEDINNKVWEENQIVHSVDVDYAHKNGVQDSFVSPICK